MRILFLAPQPFYEERGTPIAVDNALRVLSERGDTIDVVAYAQGQERRYAHVQLFRCPRLPFIGHIRPGFSWQKLVYDACMLLVIMRLLLTRRYNLVHAVEESVFIALLLRWLFRIPYVYDMDSSLSQQIAEKYGAMRKLAPFLARFERVAIRRALAVIPVCEALAEQISPYRPRRMCILHDVSLLHPTDVKVEDLRATLGVQGPLVMYVGNLEPYQGIDLLLDSFAQVAQQNEHAHLVIIGGAKADVDAYTRKADAQGLSKRVHLIGPRPVDALAAYLAQADILASPRIKGTNTPMKIYSYLDSGKAVVATNLPTHTQVMNERVAKLAAPNPAAFAQALMQLIEQPTLREQLGRAGRQLISDEYSLPVFRSRLNGLYDELQAQLEPAPAISHTREMTATPTPTAYSTEKPNV
jgi:glycosyltransferase involved in cell wall biosynthesis